MEGQSAIKVNFEFHNVLDRPDNITDNDNEINNYNTDHENEIDETRITTYNNNDSEKYESDDLDRVHPIDANDDDSVKLIQSEMEYYNNGEDEEIIPEIGERNETDPDIVDEDDADLETDYDNDEVYENENGVDETDISNLIEQDVDILPVNTEHDVINTNESESNQNNNNATTRHNLRTRKECIHQNLYEKEFQNMQQQKSNTNLKIKDKFKHVESMLMKKNRENDEYTRVSLKRGIKRFGDDVINSMMAEYSQIDDKNVFDPLMASKLS